MSEDGEDPIGFLTWDQLQRFGPLWVRATLQTTPRRYGCETLIVAFVPHAASGGEK